MNRVVLCALAIASMTGCTSDFSRLTSGSSLPAANAAQAQPSDPIVRQLRDGGYVLYIRHGKTEQAFQDQQGRPLWWKSCDTRASRPLSDEGRQQMLTIGAQMRELRIPVARIVTSEYCRAFDSGLLMQLMPVTQDARLNFSDAQRAVGRNDETMRNEMQALLSTPSLAGRNTILVGHVHAFNPPIDPVLQQLLEGETAVIRPLGGGKLELVGRIPVERWAERVIKQ